MLDCHRLVVDQWQWEWQWGEVDALYQFVDQLPTWVVDDDIIDMWASGHVDHPQSFKGWEVKKAEWGRALMLSWTPARIGSGPASADVKVFTAVVVCIHPHQTVMSIKHGAKDLINHSISKPTSSMSALCHLPWQSAGTFYPSPLNDAFLVLPYIGTKGENKKVCLDLSVVYNKHMLVHKLHRWEATRGDLAILPPIYSADPGIPRKLPVGYLSKLWDNMVYTMPEPLAGTGLQGGGCPRVPPPLRARTRAWVPSCRKDMELEAEKGPGTTDWGTPTPIPY